MAQRYLAPSTGAVVLGALVSEFSSMDITSGQTVENVTGYGNNGMTANLGNGTPDMSVNVGAFAIDGVNNTAPGLGASSVLLVGAAGSAGVACTFTLATNCTESGTFIVENIKIMQARMKAAVPLTFTLKNAGDITEAWATT